MVAFGEVIPKTNGLFARFPNTAPWNGQISATVADLRLWAALKSLEISPLVEATVTGDTVDLDLLATVIYETYGSNWARLWDAIVVQEYDILHPISEISTRTITGSHDDLETRNLSRTDGGTVTRNETTEDTNVRSGAVTEASTRTSETDDTGNETVTASNTETKSLYGVGGTGATPQESVTGSTPSTTATTGKTEADESASGTTTYDDVTDAAAGTRTGTETQTLTGSDTGTVADAGTRTETDTFDMKGSSTLHTHQMLVEEEVHIRSGVAYNFLDLIFKDIRHETCARIWVRSDYV